MMRKSRETIKRFLSSAVFALPVTVALLFLMTYLILPGEHDPVMNRMIASIQLLRSAQPPEPRLVPVFKAPPKPARQPLPSEPVLTKLDASEVEEEIVVIAETIEKEGRAQMFDWRSAVSELLDESDEEDFSRWLIEQGYDDYVSIMQGPLPITNSVRAELPPTQENATGYLNTYGDMEIKVSENCVATTQVAARFDQSDFGKRLPMRVTCKSPPKVKLTLDRN